MSEGRAGFVGPVRWSSAASAWVQRNVNALLGSVALLVAVIVVVNVSGQSSGAVQPPVALSEDRLAHSVWAAAQDREPLRALVTLDASQAGQILPGRGLWDLAAPELADGASGATEAKQGLLRALEQLLEHSGGVMVGLDLEVASGATRQGRSAFSVVTGEIVVRVPAEHAGSVVELAAEAAPVTGFRVLDAPGDTGGVDLAGRLERLRSLERQTRDELSRTSLQVSPETLAETASLLQTLQAEQRHLELARLSLAGQPDVAQVHIVLQLPRRSTLPLWPVLLLTAAALVAVGLKDRRSRAAVPPPRQDAPDAAW